MQPHAGRIAAEKLDACRLESDLVIFPSPSIHSSVKIGTTAFFARARAVHPTIARAARSCAPEIMIEPKRPAGP